jgi:squalene synthase HpnC/squalene synthase HpnD
MELPADFEIARNLPARGCSQAEAERYTGWLATHHYENFHVVSWLLPAHLHQHFYNVYAYCRWADDLGDEIADPARAIALLDDWERELKECYAGRPSHPVFVALLPTIRAFDIPAEPFSDLLIAFRQDQVVKRYQTWDQLIEYCRYSANPVGRLVLYLCGYRDAERQRLSDATCTALQLANFWQDVSRDLDKGRIYIPRDAMQRHGVYPADIEERRFDERYAALMKELIARTRVLFAEGAPLVSRVNAKLRVDLDLFGRGGLAVLDAIEAQGYDTLTRRPAIGAATRARLLGRAGVGLLRASLSPRRLSGQPAAASPTSVAASPSAAAAPGAALSVPESYAECRRVARSASSNFYFAFYMLPRAKSDALCALYAFMRLVDDVSDTPDAPVASAEAANEKTAALSRWRAMLDQAVAGDVGSHPILPAFADTLRRYRIPPRYFHDLISGVEMDLTETRYATFGRLREYCYRVAGTVGLTCLHVFGFDDPASPDLAERLGIAFQLTNILRDVSGDLALGRVYLPAEDLSRFGCSVEELSRGAVTPSVRELMRFEAERAWQFYAEGSRLLPLVHRDSRAALWALTRIYSGLLARIEGRDFDVFSPRVRLTTAEKAGILLRARLGWWSEADVLEERDRDRRRAGGAFLRRRAG